jgi:eukaryotic-like serine/threonine-protein kinase
MRTIARRTVKVGSKLNPNITVIGILDRYGDDAVCIAWHHRAWCPVACKVFACPDRAKHEADILSRLAHPNTVRFLGVEEPAILLMEFLEGSTLEGLVNNTHAKRFSVSNALRVAIHIGAALHHLHVRGFVHMDVAPSNVIITSSGRPVLFDFGTTRRLNADRPAEITGTDPFIAPEECNLGQITAAADVFGLGVVLYEMLAGALPFPEGTRKRRFPQLDTPPLPLRKRRRGIPQPLDDVIVSCLALEPKARPSLSRLLPALHEFIASGPPMWPEGFRPD